MGYVLRELNKAHLLILNEPANEKYSFLQGFPDIRTAGSVDAKYNNIITLDSPGLTRIAAVNDYLADSRFIINIDHHFDNTNFGYINIVTGASSTTEILYDLIGELGLTFTRELAEMIYTGIVFDTGVYRFSITTERAYTIGAQMKRAGARIDQVAENVFLSKDYDTIKLMAHSLTALKTHLSGRVAVISVTKQDIRDICSKEPDVGDYINYLMMLKGIKVGIFMTEIDDGFFRVSLRSKHEFDVQKIAAAFNGGGHKKAGGCRLKGSVNEITDMLINEIRKHLPNTA